MAMRALPTARSETENVDGDELIGPPKEPIHEASDSTESACDMKVIFFDIDGVLNPKRSQSYKAARIEH